MSRPARASTAVIELREGASEPLFLQIARAIAADIRRGRLGAGRRLPGSRTLARTLGVHRNTVVAAYAELTAEGWLDAHGTRGTFVSHSMPAAAPGPVAARGATAPSRRPGFALPAEGRRRRERLEAPASLDLSAGSPDIRLLPTRQIARAYRRVLTARARDVLGYGPPQGDPALRAALAEMLRTERGLLVEAEDVLTTQGTQMGLDLVARALIEPGNVVAVEALGYPPAWEAFRRYGARLVAVPIDREGLDVEALARLAARTRVRAVYLTPHHQYPTTATLTAGRRLALLELASRHRIAVLEDDYDHEFHYEGRPVLPVASADRAGVVVYFGTFAKVFAPGLRIGYVAAPRALIERLAAMRRYSDRQGDHAIEGAVAELMQSGELQRHVRRSRRVYLGRREHFCEALSRSLGGLLEYEKPSGGIALWARAAGGINVEAWAARAAESGVAVRTAKRFAFDGRARPHLRLGFGALDEREAEIGLQRLAAALPDRRRRPAGR